MREIGLHFSGDALRELGFEPTADGVPDVAVRDVTLLSSGGPGSVTVVTYSDPVDDAFENGDHVVWWERLDPGDGRTTYLCETVVPAFPEESSCDTATDFVVRGVTPENDGVTLTLLGESEAVQSIDGAAERFDDSVTLRRLADYEGPADPLDRVTERQREVLETADELGYYDVPRGATADEIASELDLDRSTVTEHLQRAERNLVSAFLDG